MVADSPARRGARSRSLKGGRVTVGDHGPLAPMRLLNPRTSHYPCSGIWGQVRLTHEQRTEARILIVHDVEHRDHARLQIGNRRLPGERRHDR